MTISATWEPIKSRVPWKTLCDLVDRLDKESPPPGRNGEHRNGTPASPRPATLPAGPKRKRPPVAKLAPRIRKYLATVPGAVSGQGGHNDTLRTCGNVVHGFDLTPDEAWEFLAEWNAKCEPPWEDNDLRRKLDEAKANPGDRGKPGYLIDADRRPADGLAGDDLPRAWNNPLRLAREVGEVVTLARVKDTWFEYRGTHYQPVSDGWVDARVRGVCEAAAAAEFRRRQEDPAAADDGEEMAAAPPVTTALVGNVKGAVAGERQMRDDVRPNTWRGGAGPRAVSCANGLLDLDSLTVRPHSPDFFTLACLPVRFDPAAPPPDRFLAVLGELMDGDADRVAVIQEFFGACLDPGLAFKHFAVWTGSGDNGKTVVLTVLRALLGEGNHTSVKLQKLGERFGAWPLFGKLANLVGEQEQIESQEEGLLKEMTGGDPTLFEQKLKDPILAVNTAKMIFSCNDPPTFGDKTNALWNRLVVVPFEHVVPADRKDPRLLDPGHWAAELPGVLNWAIAGLVRFRAAGRLTRSAKCEAAGRQHRTDSNPTRRFLLDHYCLAPDGAEPIPTRRMFASYRAWCSQSNHRPTNDKNFGREVRRAFPAATKSENAVWVDFQKGHVWYGLIPNPEFPPPDPSGSSSSHPAPTDPRELPER